jgi:hypothetical protein
MIKHVKVFKMKAIKKSIGPTIPFHVDHVYIGEPKNVIE